MDLLIKKVSVILTEEDSYEPNINKQTELSLSKNCIEVNPTRISNLRYDLIFAKETNLPDYIIINYKNDHNTGNSGNSYSSCPHYTPNLKRKFSIDGNLFKIQLYDTGGTLFYNKIGFSTQKQISENLHFDVEISHIYTYQVLANKFSDEFILNNGFCKHIVGDNFQHPSKSGIEATVMEINEENRIIFCSATGFLH